MRNFSKFHPIARAVLPAYIHKYKGFSEVEAGAGIVRVALACKLYFQERGSYPEGLDDLVPEYFDELPKDPYTGESFIYKPLSEGGFVVYSVGLNGVDSGGEPRKKGLSLPDEDARLRDDIIWWEPPIE